MPLLSDLIAMRVQAAQNPTVPRLLLEQARIAADRERNQGAISAGLFSNLGNIAANVPNQILQAKAQQQRQAMNAQEMQQRDLAIQQAKAGQQAQQQANQILSTLMTQNPDGSRTIDRAKAAQQMSAANIPPAMQATVFKSLDDVDASIRSFTQAKTDHMADLAHSAIQMIDGGLPAPLALATAGTLATGNGLASQQDVDGIMQRLSTLQPEQLKAALTGLRGASEKYKELSKPVVLPRPGSKAIDASGKVIGEVPATPERPISVAPGGTLVNPQSGKTIFTAPPKEEKPPSAGSFQDYVTKKYGANPTPAQIVQAHRDLDKPPVVVNAASVDPDIRDYWVKQVQNDPTQWQMLASNKPLQQAVQAGLAKAGTDLNKLTAQGRAMSEIAKEILPHIETIKAEADELNRLGLMGPIQGRWRDFAIGKVGAASLVGGGENARKVGKFQTDIGLLMTAVARAHGGARGGGSPAMLEHMKSIMDARGKDLSAFLGNLDATSEWMKGYAGMVPTGGPKASSKIEDEDPFAPKKKK